MALRLGLIKNVINTNLLIRNFATQLSNNKIALTDDESTFVALHPKQDFPYECTRPIPAEVPMDDTSPLKTQLIPQFKQVFDKRHPDQVIQELMNITHTCRHRWYRRARDKKAKKTPMDREYL